MELYFTAKRYAGYFTVIALLLLIPYSHFTKTPVTKNGQAVPLYYNPLPPLNK